MIGNLRYIVLRNLRKKPQSGYSLIKQIREDTGCWKPSPGSLYPLLEELKKKGLVSVVKDGRKKVYSLTSPGKDELHDLEKKKGETIDYLINQYKIFESVSGHKEAGFMVEVLESIKKGEAPFKEIHSDLIKLKVLIFQLHKAGKISQHKKEITLIIQDTVRKLKKFQ